MKNNLGALSFFFTFFLLALLACNANNAGSKLTSVTTPHELAEMKIADSLHLLNTVAKPGDLVARLGDDFLSHQIRYMSQKDPSFSHVGIIVSRGGQNLVCHIYPDAAGGDTVHYEAVDSFLNPKNTLTCALFRYNFSGPETAAFLATLDSFARHGVHFDKVYDLSSDNVYCSEMIYKSLVKATNGRITPKLAFPPPKMLPLLMRFFAKEKPTETQIAKRKFVSIDDLYLMPECKRILSFGLQPVE